MAKLCKCGCGQEITSINPRTKQLREYISGHNSRGKPSYFRTKEWRIIHSKFMTENNPMKLLKNKLIQSKAQKGRKHPEEVKEKIRQSAIKQHSSGGMPYNDTKIERIVENYLIFNNIIYIKQFPYKLGVADFWLPESNTIIECDGDYWHSLPGRKEQDKKQTTWLEENDYMVLRFSETELNSCFNACIEQIRCVI